MMTYLAETAQPDMMISGNWLVGALVALIPVIIAAWFKGKQSGVKEATNNVTIQPPFPEVPFRKVANPVSFDQHSALDARVARIETHLDRIERDQSLQYKQILEAGAERELRMTEVMNDGLRAVHERLDQILNNRPPTRR